jgi:hypothetical protein
LLAAHTLGDLDPPCSLGTMESQVYRSARAHHIGQAKGSLPEQAGAVDSASSGTRLCKGSREARLGLEGWKQSREKVGTVVSASSQSFQVLRRMDVWTDGGQGFRVGDHELELVPLSDNSQL